MHVRLAAAGACVVNVTLQQIDALSLYGFQDTPIFREKKSEKTIAAAGKNTIYMAATVTLSTFDGTQCTHHVVLNGVPGLNEQRRVSYGGIICPFSYLLTDALHTHETESPVVLYTWIPVIAGMT